MFSQRREIHFVIITETSAHTNTHQFVDPLQTERQGHNVSGSELYKHFEYTIAVKERCYNGQGMWHAWGKECIQDFAG